ncbi:MAG: DUF1016 family protein [Candidatus Heimdallarchaeota archaeon]|nr:DUF1016 family protein [Candidatus Heimdallarchaeota archaeon]
MKINRKHNDFDNLVAAINQIHNKLSKQVHLAININLTKRNWLIGYYIQEYEQHGEDRALYGKELIVRLSERLQKMEIGRVEERELRRYRQFYQTYPQIRESLTPELKKSLISAVDEKWETVTPISGKQLISRLSFSHIAELLRIDDTTKRTFYEIECIHGNWSVRELRRQINSLYYERSGLSLNKQKLSELANQNAEQSDSSLAIRDPYVFEFLGLKAKEVMGESHLEDALLDKIQEFLLELGHGFCFEARQKRILIGNNHYFIDLVFYHRILKCHVLVELKLAAFSHENIGQLNTYVSWYKKNMITDGDNPPIGILLCTDKDHALVEYALSDMDDNLFVSKYQLELPKEEEMQRFIEEKLRESILGN